MNFQFYMEKLKSSENFKEFMEKNKDAFLCSGFFSIDKIGKDNKQHLDYFVEGRVISFQLENDCKEEVLESYGNKIPEKIEESIDFNFEEVFKIIGEKIAEEKIQNAIQKFLFSLQRVDGKDFLIGTIFLSGLGIVKINIGLLEKKVVEFEKKSFFDMIKIMRKKE